MFRRAINGNGWIIKHCVRKLFDNGIVSVHETDSGTVFTIVKYEEYQRFEGIDETINETERDTFVERRRNEDGTTPEREQELKNLRIKELKDTTTAHDEKFSASLGGL